MKKTLILLILIFIIPNLVIAQSDLLQNGPMIGHSQMREVALWLQTKSEAAVKAEYWVKKENSEHFFTDEIVTKKEKAFTANLVADQVEPGMIYGYRIYINDQVVEREYELEFKTQTLWQWRTDPPEFSFITGSCAYINEEQYDRPGKPYGSEYKIFETMAENPADFMLWLGDNYYYREADYYSRTGMIKRITHDRSIPELQKLWATKHHYAIWDDHDFGPNNSDRSYIHKDTVLELFKLFWANPGYGVNGNKGITTYFQWSDVDFFLLDNRYFRTPNDRRTGKRVMLGDEQLNWLIDALSNSNAPFKFVVIGGQVLNPTTWAETYAIFPEEKEKLLNAIRKEGITGVVFLDGDRHMSEISKLERRGTYPLYDFTISSLTAGVNNYPDEPNFLRVEGSLMKQHNFAEFSFSGKRNDRTMTCKIFDVNGNELYKISIHENELK
ncbi:MAG: alkaline phosphatase D family protein [Melioribacteraceae bacterium]|nr:alkaline phosphatase family protein [Melioribacteraceae bacterium]MDD3558841.1 alkaline phosphatase D family protein [Melioribacteraceae bacterium]